MRASPPKSPSPLTLPDLLGRRAVLALLPVVFAASFALAQAGADKRRSGYQDMGAALQKMQDDDTANPFVSFFTVATESGTIALRWSGDEGFVAEHRVAITVT